MSLTPEIFIGITNIQKGLATFRGILEERNLGAPGMPLRLVRPANLFLEAARRQKPGHCGFIVQGFMPGLPELLADWQGAAVVVHGVPGQTPPRFPLVIEDDRQYGRTAAEHILATGARQYACLWPKDWFVPTRRKAFEERMAEAGVPGQTIFTGFHAEAGFSKAVRSTIQRLVGPTGIFINEPEAGARIIGFCRDLGKRVPEDISVLAGQDDESLCHASNPAVSGIPENDFEVGRLALRLLIRQFAGVETKLGETYRVPVLPVAGRGSTDILYCGDEVLLRAIRAIKQTLPDQVVVPDIAKAAGVNRVTLARRCRRHLGMTPAHLVLKLRVEYARHLLSHSRGNMAEIAQAAGFADNAHFTRTFRRFKSLSPTEFRQSFQVSSQQAEHFH